MTHLDHGYEPRNTKWDDSPGSRCYHLKKWWFLLEDDFYPRTKKMVKLRNQPFKKVVAKDFQGSSNFHQFPYKGGPLSVINGVITRINGLIEGSLNRNFRQYGELKSSSRVVKSVDRRCNSQKVRRKKIHPRQMLEKSRNAVFFQ